MTWFGVWILSAIVGSMILFGGRRKDGSGRRRFPRVLIAVAAIAGGLALVRHHARHNLDEHDWDPTQVAWTVGSLDSHEMPRWMLVSLVTVIVISGVLLARRDRIRPVTIKLFTALGIAAGCFALVSFFGTPPRDFDTRHHVVRVVGHDHVVHDPPLPRHPGEVARRPAAPEPPVVPDAARKPRNAKRTTHAKRPTYRGERSVKHESSLEEDLPPRAGEIPVAAELAAASEDSPSASKSSTPQAAAVEAPPATENSAAAAAPSAEVAAPPAETPAPSTPAAASEAAAAEPASAPAPTAPATETPQAVAAPEPPKASTAPESTPSAPSDESARHAVANSNQQPDTTTPPAKPATEPDLRVIQRPDWVEAPGKLEGSVYSVGVKSGLYVDVPECQHALDDAIKHETDRYIEDYLGAGASQVVDISRSYLRSHVKKAEFAEVVESTSVGPMHQIHALLQFDDDVRADFHRRWRDAMITGRLWYVGSGAALVLALLGTFYGYLKLDLRTGGSQSGRLQLAAALVALIVAAGALLVRWAVPF
jgi:hypothetical protein